MTVGNEARERVAAITRERGPTAAAVGLTAAWWPVAFSHTVGRTPMRASLAATALCLYRGADGHVRAVLDQCPHRRLPLSMGRVTPDGAIQCGYHGWCFDGATGRCTAIPNLHADERVSPSIRVRAFTTAERLLQRRGTHAPPTTPVGPGEGSEDALTMFATSVADGFVHVWTGDGAAPETERRTGDGAERGAEWSPLLSGEFEVRAPHRLVADVLALAPGAALGLGLLLGAGEEVVRPTVDADGDGDATRIVRERRLLDIPRVATYEPRGRRTVLATSTTSTATGLTTIDAERDDGKLHARVVAALTPVGDYRTVVRWHAALAGHAAPRLITRTAASVGRRRHPERRLERLADDLAAGTIDPGVEHLRARRTAT
jgi:nitrite reductase/ring-hydroxylating ferredoxin subunit